MKRITIEIIPHQNQRYNTPGDYELYPNGEWVIRVSDLGNPIYNVAVALHELAELSLLDYRGVKEPDVLAFDLEFEANRTDPDAEPGFAPNNDLYQQEHMIGTAIEMMLLSKAGIKWSDYEQAFKNLPEWKKLI